MSGYDDDINNKYNYDNDHTCIWKWIKKFEYKLNNFVKESFIIPSYIDNKTKTTTSSLTMRMMILLFGN
jgi:hypothetical protein